MKLRERDGAYKSEYERLMSNPGLTFRFKEMLARLDDADVIDAMNEVYLLEEMLNLKLEIIRDAEACGEEVAA